MPIHLAKQLQATNSRTVSPPLTLMCRKMGLDKKFLLPMAQCTNQRKERKKIVLYSGHWVMQLKSSSKCHTYGNWASPFL